MTRPRPGAELPRAVQLVRAHRFDEAERLCLRAIEQDGDGPGARQILGAIAIERGRLDEALDHFERGLAVEPNAISLICRLGDVLKLQGRYGPSGERFDEALARDPGYAPALAGKAEILERRGAPEDARALLAPIVASGGAALSIVRLYALMLQRLDRHREAADLLAKHLANPTVPSGARVGLLYALGRSLERIGEHDGSFAALRRANELSARPYDIDRDRGRFARLREVFARDRMAKLPRSGSESEQMVFVVGMPRCGSTLVERILDAHPRVRGVGENDVIHVLAHGAGAAIGSQKPFPDVVDDLDQAAVDRMSDEALARFAALGAEPTACEADRIVDKSLGNFSFLGLIAMILPRARVIHCVRDPMSIGFSCYANPLPLGPHGYSTSLADLGRFHRAYSSLMEHWKTALEIPILEVEYEHVVADQEQASRRIVDFCGLPWDDACLRFHETKRDVATTSYDQVRRPLYDSSLRRYAPYEKHLGPLRDALEESSG